MAVSRPVKDSCSVTPAGALLVSSSNPGIKLHFPPDSTVQTRTVTLQVGTMSTVVLQQVRIHRNSLSVVFKASSCLSVCRCCTCLCQRYKQYAVILRPQSALSSASPRLPTYISCNLSKFRSRCHLESKVQYAIFLFEHVNNRMYQHV